MYSSLVQLLINRKNEKVDKKLNSCKKFSLITVNRQSTPPPPNKILINPKRALALYKYQCHERFMVRFMTNYFSARALSFMEIYILLRLISHPVGDAENHLSSSKQYHADIDKIIRLTRLFFLVIS